MFHPKVILYICDLGVGPIKKFLAPTYLQSYMAMLGFPFKTFPVPKMTEIVSRLKLAVLPVEHL